MPPHYVVFFELSRDTKRKRRLVLKVQSAYLKEPFDPALSKEESELRQAAESHFPAAPSSGLKKQTATRR